MPIIPFGLLPAHWGKAGKTLAIAKAEYELTGENLDRRLIEINIEDKTEQTIQLLKVDLKYDHISEEDFDRKVIKSTVNDEPEQAIQLFKIDLKYNHISKDKYEKEVATLKDEPWVGVIHSEYNPREGTNGFSFELDWNNKFVEYLAKNGYTGATPEHIVEQWFEDKAAEEYLGIMMEDDNTGNDFIQDSEHTPPPTPTDE